MKNQQVNRDRTFSVKVVAPMLFGYFVMGFMDVVGISTSYVQADFAGRLPAEMFGFLPSVLFFWFLVLSVPTALLMNRIGRKNTVLLSMFFTFIGMVLPLVAYTFPVMLAAFALLGIGNTILQVSINPLISNVVDDKSMTSVLTVGQLLKSVCALSGPFIALLSAQYLGNWRMVFAIYAIVTLIASAWLLLVRVKREAAIAVPSVGATFALLRKREILLLFIGMAAFLAMDIGTNTEAPRLLMERLGLDPNLTTSVERASHAAMPYFLCRLLGALAGAFILARWSAIRYFRINTLLLLAAVCTLFFAQGEGLILTLYGIIGLACSGLFPVILATAMQYYPERANEISGLMITAICGGTIITPAMSYAVKICGGSQSGAVAMLLLAAIVLIAVSFSVGPGQRRASVA